MLASPFSSSTDTKTSPESSLDRSIVSPYPPELLPCITTPPASPCDIKIDEFSAKTLSTPLLLSSSAFFALDLVIPHLKPSTSSYPSAEHSLSFLRPDRLYTHGLHWLPLSALCLYTCSVRSPSNQSPPPSLATGSSVKLVFDDGRQLSWSIWARRT